jgi:hypothetical protein
MLFKNIIMISLENIAIVTLILHMFFACFTFINIHLFFSYWYILLIIHGILMIITIISWYGIEFKALEERKTQETFAHVLQMATRRKLADRSLPNKEITNQIKIPRIKKSANSTRYSI